MSENVRAGKTLQLRSAFPQSGKPGKPGKPTELEVARAEVERARADAEAARDRADRLHANMLRTKRDAKVRLRVTAVMMMAAALIRMGWQSAHEPAPIASSVDLLPIMASGPRATPYMKVGASTTPAEQSATNAALERLRTAFHSIPEEDQMDLVREINAKSPSGEMTCPIVWRDGVPALYVGNKKESAPWVAAALNRCAEGVEQLRAEKDAVAQRR